jgi:leader peptidase (prepilin peptidase)/N-methyltransferase
LLGLIVGSFMATLVARWPEGRSVAKGRSSCDTCEQPLTPFDLVPVLSFVWLKGRCRRCGARISIDHLLIELACGVCGAAALGTTAGWAGLAGAVFGWLLVALAALDLRHYWLPDRLTGALALAGLTSGLAGLSPPLADRLWGGLTGFASLWAIAVVYRMVRKREGLGGGDPKLLGALGLWLGWQSLPILVLGACLAGMLWVVTRLTMGRAVKAADRVPLGAFLAIAGFICWLASGLAMFAFYPANGAA